MRTIKRIMDEALGGDCQVGCDICPYSGRILQVPANAGQGQPVPLLAAAAPDRS